jgi:hypothetical protein
VPIASREAKAAATLVNQPSPCPQVTNQINQRRQITHRSTPASVRTPPAVSSLEAFRTPASVRLLTPCPAGVRKPLTIPVIPGIPTERSMGMPPPSSNSRRQKAPNRQTNPRPRGPGSARQRHQQGLHPCADPWRRGIVRARGHPATVRRRSSSARSDFAGLPACLGESEASLPVLRSCRQSRSPKRAAHVAHRPRSGSTGFSSRGRRPHHPHRTSIIY